ncbi:DL-endopeptidase inhibitor IseA family protein [Lutispora thermophila]|uniref:IseA DL-endopeptidase inhibitor n=1 Tax=Lutispora thermophila DSM 19022 TaxID=1122184 RepID=A0A1M6BDG3_9FIRM|nr:DL-endopeptidase inhibitor IseA family protein [Lutispora thermophila]SHI46755.1 IseA DL-endopeptidase inhibitor [Lutispora thermophila DSM 19022]
MPYYENTEMEYNGNIYWKVAQDGFESLFDLKAYLKDFFSDEIIDSLLETDRYIDIDGVLYTIDAARGTDIFAGEEYHRIIRESDKKIIYEVTVDILDENFEKVVDKKIYSFPYELIEGRWVFTDFCLVR